MCLNQVLGETVWKPANPTISVARKDPRIHVSGPYFTSSDPEIAALHGCLASQDGDHTLKSPTGRSLHSRLRLRDLWSCNQPLRISHRHAPGTAVGPLHAALYLPAGCGLPHLTCEKAAAQKSGATCPKNCGHYVGAWTTTAGSLTHHSTWPQGHCAR